MEVQTSRSVPQELVFPFYNHQPATIASVVLTLADSLRAPKEVEVWTSTVGPDTGLIASPPRP